MYILTNGERIVKDFSLTTCTVSGVMKCRFTSFVPYMIKSKLFGYLIKPFLMEGYYPVKITYVDLTSEYVESDKPFIIQWVGNDNRLIKIDHNTSNLSKVKKTNVMVKGMGYYNHSEFKVLKW